MAYKDTRLLHHIADEAQLIAEERWILGALAKIKTQRNCLQIERLHLESLKTQKKVGTDNSLNPKQKALTESEGSADMPSTSTVNLMQNTVTGSKQEYNTFFNEYCNNEVLDLQVNNQRFGYGLENAETDLEEDDEDLDNDEDVLIDMEMLMSGK